jgi:heme/copper-type cytochrome/quinol oxidase subunit 3
MFQSKSFLFLVVGIVLLHFLIGIGWLLYKIMHAEKKTEDKDLDEDSKN